MMIDRSPHYSDWYPQKCLGGDLSLQFAKGFVHEIVHTRSEDLEKVEGSVAYIFDIVTWKLNQFSEILKYSLILEPIPMAAGT